MRKGDILLINYFFDPIGWLIKWVTHSKWNHIAFALNEFVVIEGTGRGVKTTHLSKYLDKRWFTIKLIRFKDLSKPKINKLAVDLVSQRTKTPYWKFFISYFLVAFGCKPLCTNCSLLLYEALKRQNHGIKMRNNVFINPEDFNSYDKAIDITDQLPIGA